MLQMKHVDMLMALTADPLTLLFSGTIAFFSSVEGLFRLFALAQSNPGHSGLLKTREALD